MARAASTISAADAAIFNQAHVFAVNEECYREGQVCLVLSERVFERDPEGFLPLLTTWGGEGLYRSSCSVSFRARLKTLGAATRVVALLALEDASRHSVFPALHRVFVASLLGLPDVGADVHYRSPIPPEHIERIEEVHHLSRTSESPFSHESQP
jgi:hypothetical protein